MRIPLRLFALPLATLLGLLVLTAPAQAAAAAYCGISWGSLAQGDSVVAPGAGTTLSNVRAGEHGCYDRVVIDLRAGQYPRSWRVEYVPAVTEDASGRPIALRGGAYLLITVGADAHTVEGRPTYAPADRRELVSTTGFQTLRQVALAGSFEGVTTVAVGVRARLPVRVLTVSGPASGQERLVLDIAHRW